LASRGLCPVALLGVWNWKGKNDLGGTTILADWDYVALDGREVRIVFDSDVMVKVAVRSAISLPDPALASRTIVVPLIRIWPLPEGITAKCWTWARSSRETASQASLGPEVAKS